MNGPNGYSLSIWKIHYSVMSAERVSTCGGMDSELTGKSVKNSGARIFLAPTEKVALAAYDAQFPSYTVESVEFLGMVDTIVRLDGASQG